MLKFFVALFVLLCSFQTNAAHILSGSIDFEIDPANNYRYTFYTTLYHIGNQSMPQIVFISGPTSHSELLESRDTIDWVSCTLPVIKSVYKSSAMLLPVPGPAGFTFSYDKCCDPGFENTASSVKLYVSVTVYRKWDPVQGAYRHHQTGTWSTEKPPLFNVRERGLAQSVRFSPVLRNPLVDSIQATLAWPFSAASSRINWALGFNQFAPFPDSTENPLNAANTITSPGLINFNVQTIGDSIKYYIYGMRYNHYRGGYRSARQFINAALVLMEPDSIQAMPQVVLRENGIIQNSTHPSQVFDYEVYVGDTLTVLLRADHPFNQGIEAEYKGNNLQQNLLSSNPLYSDAIVTPLNSTAGSFYNLDSNLVLFEWVPLRDNYFLGPKEVEYYFTFKDSTCSFPKRQSVTMRVQLKLKSTIGLLSNQPIATDTLSLCIYDSVNLKNLGDSLNFQWSHPDINNTNLSSQMEISFKPVSSAWLYITDTLGVKLDSVYLYYIPSSIVQLQHDNTRLTYNPQIAPVTPKNWLYNGAIPIYSSTGLDNMLIQGAGTYQWVYDASGDTCAQASSIETFANGPKWGAIFPTSEVILAQDYAAEFFFDFEVSARKDLDKIFIVGLVPKAINTYGTNQQRVIIELFEDNISIEKSTKFFLGTTELVSAMSSALEVGKDYRMRILLKAGDFYNVHKVAGLSYPFNSGDLLIKAVGHIDYAGVESPATSCPSIGLEFKNYVGREEKELSYLKVYPNPSENLIKVEFGERLIYAYEVLGTDGKLHLKGLLNNNEFIDISHLPKGIYYLKLGNGLSEKIVKN